MDRSANGITGGAASTEVVIEETDAWEEGEVDIGRTKQVEAPVYPWSAAYRHMEQAETYSSSLAAY